jgi:glutamate-ammonia-ligase adenylyltransferase
VQPHRLAAWPEVAAGADPERALLGLDRLQQALPEAIERAGEDALLRRRVVAVLASGPFLTRICVTDPMAADVLAAAGSPVEPLRPLSRWKALELLRVGALDLTGELALEAVGEALANLADGLLQAACADAGAGGLAVIGMGKLGARELNYGSDIDIVFVGEGEAMAVLDLVRPAWRTDLGLRPEGRAGALVRSLEAYQAYWERWAETWEFQALIKARPVAGDPGLGQAFAAAASRRVWGRPLGEEEIRSLRQMKARSEQLVGRRGLAAREIKLGRGGIRDIEFSVQLLQLVHGREDASLRAPATLPALAALGAGGYIAPEDAQGLERAYRFLRTVEHRLQLFEDRQVHALPETPASRAHLARVMGYRDRPGSSALGQFEAELARQQATARAIHERLFFRPLLEAFSAWPRASGEAALSGAQVPGEGLSIPPRATTGGSRLPASEALGHLPGSEALGALAGAPAARARLDPSAVQQRLVAFGFSDAKRTREAVAELTQGFSRTSRLMKAMVPLLLDWLSSSPDPDLGLLGLRRLSTGPHRRAQLSTLFRESAEAARRLCLLLGTSPLFAEGYEHHPEQLALLGDGLLASPELSVLERRAAEAIAWRPREEWWRGFASLVRAELLRVQARDVLGLADLAETEASVTSLATAVLRSALAALAGPAPEGARAGPRGPAPARGGLPQPEGIALVAMGRFGGAELSYASDLDLVVVFDEEAVEGEEAEKVAEDLLRFVNGPTPAQGFYRLDLSLRPEGRKGALARSLKAYEAYYERWAQPWERQALLRARFVAGDPLVGERFVSLTSGFLWGKPLTEADVREMRRLKARMERERVPAGEDPEFHLKLGPGSLSDVEWTAQLLQLQASVPAQGTLGALRELVSAGVLTAGDADTLVASYRFCEATRNRLYLVRGRPGDSLPPPGRQLTSVARSLGTTAPELREQYRRLTRRARAVTERLFYGKE